VTHAKSFVVQLHAKVCEYFLVWIKEVTNDDIESLVLRDLI